ncbi:sulfurtransferase [Blastococcus sp. Marseille-P5729]|uniref:sulfurtransferase n=1 Tax=Blastococcus sp. Marseille-P5729 TaxID=2086582 RepID=UPI000D10CE5F|nr:sulfurtransferase [Blastococcus sp. Marseille-P5729]
MTDQPPALVTASWLNEHLDDVKVLDCTTHMTPQPVGPSKITSGRPDFERGHIPGAQHVDMVEDFSDPDGEYPYTLPGAEQIEALLSRLGITNDDTVVLYTQSHLMVATRVWYVLRALGHKKVAILDGGLQGWGDAGYPVTTELALPEPSTYTAHPDAARYASKSDVAAASGSGSTLVVNALSAEQHAGTGGAHYGRPGRIPGSISVPTADILRDASSFVDADQIRQRFLDAGVREGTPVITYCGGGIAATVDAFALELTGHDRWAVYDNSLLEWSSDPANPMDSDA